MEDDEEEVQGDILERESLGDFEDDTKPIAESCKSTTVSPPDEQGYSP